MSETARVTQAEYARLRQLSRQRVHQLVKDGRIPLDPQGLVIVDQADANLAQMLDQRRANRERQIAFAETGPTNPASVPPEGVLPEKAASVETSGRPAQGDANQPPQQANAATDYWEHKARRERVEADRAELLYRKTVGELVDADEVARSRRETGYKVASSLLQIPAKVAPAISPQDPQRAVRLLTEEIHRVLNELAGDLDQSAGAAERDDARAA